MVNTIYSGTAYKFECYEKSNHRQFDCPRFFDSSIWKPKQLSNNQGVSVPAHHFQLTHGFHFSRRQGRFSAPNGVTYHWDGEKWVTKTFKADESALEGYATEEWTEEKIADAMLDGTDFDLSSYATIEFKLDTLVDEKLQIEELGVTKGTLTVRRHTWRFMAG